MTEFTAAQATEYVEQIGGGTVTKADRKDGGWDIEVRTPVRGGLYTEGPGRLVWVTDAELAEFFGTPDAPLFDTDSSEYGRPETGTWPEDEADRDRSRTHGWPG